MPRLSFTYDRAGAVSICLFVAFICFLSQIRTSAAAIEPMWSNPQTLALKKVGSAPSNPAGRIAFEDNLDCQLSSYRLNGTNQSVSSCYQATAFGYIDVRSGLISFAGDDATTVPLTTFGSREIIVPWPESGAVLSANSVSNQGAFIGLYKNILGVTEDRRNLLGQVVEKRITRPADIQLKNSSGQYLIANFNSLAFSDGGSWLIAEGYDGYFVRINLATLSVRPFATAFGTSSGFNQSQVAVTPNGRYAVISNHAAQTFRVYDLDKCSTPDQPQVCPSHDYWPKLVQQAGNLYHPVHVRFLNNGLISFTDVSNNIDTAYLLAPTAEITNNLAYLALGDSYTSGEGAFAYRAGTDTDDNQCHISSRAYPDLLTKEMFFEASAKSVACAGAKISDIVGRPDYPGQVRAGVPLKDRWPADVDRILSNFEPGILPQSAFVSRYQPNALTVSIGGNDIGFGNFLKLCAAPHLNRQLSNKNDCFATYEDRLELAETIDAQVPKLTKLYKKLQLSAPNSTIFAIGYPLIAVDTGKCALNVRLNTSELALSIEIIKQLNNAIAWAATVASVSYVDIEEALAGHRLCETSSDRLAMHGVTAGSDGGPTISLGNRSTQVEVLGKASFHPNAFGHELIKQAILTKTQGFKLKPPKPALKPPATTIGEKILSGPKTGRKTKSKQPGSVTKQKSAKKGSSVAISVKGKGKGLKLRQPYSIGISDGQTSLDLGTIVSNDEGDIEGTLILLPIVRPGTHEISVIGDDQLGNPVAIIDVITVIENEADYDGDGVVNEDDSCLTIFNSGQDEDNDGIDDACDELLQINPAPSNTIATPVMPATPTTLNPQNQNTGSTDSANISSNIIPSPAQLSTDFSTPSKQLVGPAKLSVASNSEKPGSVAQGSTLGVQSSSKAKLPYRSPNQNQFEFQKLPRIPWLKYFLGFLVLAAVIDVARRLAEKKVSRKR